ncbi:hypothetical protein AVEN_115135-1 [Araneus ventricosus]|uniref:Uncharacterized protein n=1 Tax=Araneus ventricosus TaxID=182803 RepID=A0A4Y1ZXD5_ARAVE|nr:hypothetical protein AVEN_115135-1 [Araneus ventricosus]
MRVGIVPFPNMQKELMQSQFVFIIWRRVKYSTDAQSCPTNTRTRDKGKQISHINTCTFKSPIPPESPKPHQEYDAINIDHWRFSCVGTNGFPR